MSGCTAPSSASPLTPCQMSSQELEIQLDLAESYLRTGRNRQALEKLLQIENTVHDSSRLFFDLGHVYSLTGDYRKAKTSFERAVTLEPRFGDAWNYLGQVHAVLKEYDDAIAAYTKVLALPRYLRQEIPAYNLADLYNTRGATQLAEKYARMSIEKNWRFIPAYLLLGDILINQNKVDEAQKWYEQGAESDLTDTRIMLALAENLIRQDKDIEARQWLMRVIETAPGSDDAQMAREYLQSIR